RGDGADSRQATRAAHAVADDRAVAGARAVKKRVIITGDDFELALAINEAIEDAHRSGVLTTTSLLIGARHASDAIERARNNRGLRVDLHLALCKGWPILPPEQIPDLVDADDSFPPPVRAFVRLLLGGARVRRQLEAEIRAQLAAFFDTGLELDHLNGHNN